MGEIVLKRMKKRTSVPASVIKRVVEEVFNMPVTRAEMLNPPLVIITRSEPPKKKASKKKSFKKATRKQSGVKRISAKKAVRKKG